MGTMRPMRVLKGKKLAGHMGSEVVTVQNLEIIEVNTNENYILVSGNIPGPKNSLVLIRSAVKGGTVTPKEIVSYESDTTEVIESSTNVEPENVEETVENASNETVTEEVAEPVATEEAKESETQEKEQA